MKKIQDALFICYKQSPDNAHLAAFTLRSSSPRLIEDETFNDSDIMNNFIVYEDIPIKKMCKIPKRASTPCTSGYRNIYKQLSTRSSSQKLISYFMLPKNKPIEIVPSSDESDF
ncbi:UNVERIFIED_CONTAM: hypothetical protein NCL1_51513 [Trichonephila clavipes]